MFTIRFNCHQPSTVYKSYSCRAYSVKHGNGEARVLMQFPDGELFEEQIGDEAPYGVAYVTNIDSRTIDVIRRDLK